jgi:hypothetical protein
LGYTSYSAKKRGRVAVDLSLGVIGSALPGQVQTILHKIGDSKPPNGWQHRIGTRTIFAPNFRINSQINILSVINFNWATIRQLNLQQVSELNAGLFESNLKYGFRLNGFNYDAQQCAHLTFNHNSTKSELSKFRFNPYFSAIAQLVFHNSTLQGLPWITSPYELNADDIYRIVYTFDIGFTLQYRKMFLKYNVKVRSKEFYEFSKDWHTWAGIVFGFHV